MHDELDLVTTPAGDLVAMVHCNNGASELGAWAEVFGQFAAALGQPAEPGAVFEALLRSALNGDADGGGLLAYNYLSGEPITGLEAGRPLFTRTPDSRLTLANFARTQVYSAFGTLEPRHARAAPRRGSSWTRCSRTAACSRPRAWPSACWPPRSARRWPWAARRARAAPGASRCSPPTGASARGAAAPEQDLGAYLGAEVFADAALDVVEPDADDVAGFAAFLERYSAGLAIERAAVAALRTRDTTQEAD